MSGESQPSTAPPGPRFSQWRWWASRQAIGYLMQQAVENPDVISLAAGLVDPATLPVEETRDALAGLLSDDLRARQALQYGTTQGSERLRKILLKHLAGLEGCAPDELGVDVDQIVLTTGSQQFLSLVSEVLLDPGDICLVAAPTYFVFLGVLNGLGARAVPIPADEHGMQMDALESTLEGLEAGGELDRVKMIYVVSYYENPSGTSLSAERREQVVRIAKRWSKRHRIYVVEDAAYRELRYDGPRLPSVWSYDRKTVILAQTFSKSFSPGLRVGFGMCPKELLAPVCDRKGNEDFGSANLNQHLLAAVMEGGLYRAHVERLRRSYREKRDCMLRAAETHFAGIPGVTWLQPHGGLYVWMTLPPDFDTGFESELFRRATRVERVMYVPGELFFAGEPTAQVRNHMRLSFGVQSPEGIELGMERLSSAVRAVLNQREPSMEAKPQLAGRKVAAGEDAAPAS
jgi:2-aminoadipate transaminase